VEFIALEWESNDSGSFSSARPRHDPAVYYFIRRGLHIPGWEFERQDHPMLGVLRGRRSTVEEAKALIEADWVAQQRLNAWLHYMVNNAPLPAGAEFPDGSWSETTKFYAEFTEQRINAWLRYMINNDPT
jgi:hypothetical protein